MRRRSLAMSVFAAVVTGLCFYASPAATAHGDGLNLNLHGPRQGTASEPLTFVATVTGDDLPDDLIFIWDFGDGSSAQGATVTHVYAEAGSYELAGSVASAGQAELSDVQNLAIGIQAADPTAPDLTTGGVFTLVDGVGGGPYGTVGVSQQSAAKTIVTVNLRGARKSRLGSYGVSMCRAEENGDVSCVPPGTALGVRICQTQNPNTSIIYCGHVDANGNWASTGALRDFVYPDLPFQPNLVLLWNVNDGTDYYTAIIGPGVPDTLNLNPLVLEPDSD